MRLFIAEKPELAKAIADGLGGGKKGKGYWTCGKDYVTWCFGHMLQLLDPEDYDPKYKKWDMDHLPISHIPWRLKPDPEKEDQLNQILALLEKADSVVHAGDPDPEGQLLVDEILDYVDCKLPVQRLLINDNNLNVVKKALNSMRDNEEFRGLSQSALARSVGDQLYGYNLTRAYTLAASKVGYQGVLSVGRVQTTVLGMVVRRTRAFGEHEKAFYYKVIGQFEVEGISFPAGYQVAPEDPVDEKGRLSDGLHAEELATLIKGKPARLVSANTLQKEKHPPLPYNLLNLQRDASRKYGYKPDQVKDITQSLREKHKLITYNRSDCEYLSDEQHIEAPNVFKAIAKTAPMLSAVAERSDPKIKSRAFNSAKVGAHHGIIPTEGTADFSRLSEPEQKIYLLVARAYLAQFFPKQQYDETTLFVEVEGHKFGVRSMVTTRAGWLALYRNDTGNEDLVDGEEDDVSIDFRKLQAGQSGDCVDAEAQKKETKPQPLYTMSSLLADLTRVAKYVRDDRLRNLLIERDKDKPGEHGGIGTSATRDVIINTLFERGYFAEKGKSIISTDTANEFYDVLPDQAKYPDMTAVWHEQGKSIEAGKLEIGTFIERLMQYITKEVESVKANGLQIKVAGIQCTKCKTGFLRRFPRKGEGAGFFWSCTRYQEGCDASYDDKGGKPVPKVPVTISQVHKCKVCQKGLSRRQGVKRPGKPATPWWSCSGYPDCKERYPDIKGKPDFSRK